MVEAVAVDQNGEIVHAQGYGMADLEQGVPMTPDSSVYSGSVSKQVVAMAALILNRQGKIDLDEPVRTYLPELPEYADTITIRVRVVCVEIPDHWSVVSSRLM